MIFGGMKKNNIILIVCSLLALACPVRTETQVDLQKLVPFADYLFDKGEYYRAITEYHRYLFSCLDCHEAPYAEWKIAMAYQNGDQPTDARLHAQNVIKLFPQSPYAVNAPVLIAASYRAEERYSLAAIELDQFGTKYIQEYRGQEAILLASLQYLRAEDTTSAKEILSELPETSPLSNEAQKLINEIDLLNDLPQKNPLLAGSLSAIIPGAGQFYIGKKSDGFIAFVLNGLLLYATYSAFENEEYVTGGLLAVIESGWYFGNIYNAMNGAHQYNRNQRVSVLDNLDLQFTPIPSTDRPSVGISALFRF